MADARGSVPRSGPTVPDGPPAPAGVALLPCEEVLLLSVALPRMPATQRRAAAAFAAEDRIARPLDAVHVALIGPAPDPGCWLVAVVDRAALPRHAGPLRLVPEAMALPLPPPGHAAVWAGAARAVLRLADGTGLAVPLAMLPLALHLAGRPQVQLVAGNLPDGLPAISAAAAVLVPPDIDLRRAGQPAPLPVGVGRLALLGVAVVAGHLALMGAGVVLMTAQAGRLAGDVRAALAASGRPAGADLDAALAVALAPLPVARQDGFLAVFATTAAALQATPGGPVLRDLSYSASTGQLSLTVEATALVTLQALQAEMSARGLRVMADAATSGDGLAELRVTVAAGAP